VDFIALMADERRMWVYAKEKKNGKGKRSKEKDKVLLTE